MTSNAPASARRTALPGFIGGTLLGPAEQVAGDGAEEPDDRGDLLGGVGARDHQQRAEHEDDDHVEAHHVRGGLAAAQHDQERNEREQAEHEDDHGELKLAEREETAALADFRRNTRRNRRRLFYGNIVDDRHGLAPRVRASTLLYWAAPDKRRGRPTIVLALLRAA